MSQSQVGNPVGATLRRRRRSSSSELPYTSGQKIYDYVLLGLMLPGSLGAIFLFGGTVGWVGGPFMILGFLGAFLYFLRPTFFADYRVSRAPVTGLLWLLVLGYVLFRLLVKPVVPYNTRIEFLQIASFLAAFWVWSELARTRGRWRWLLIFAIVLVTLTAWYALILHVQESRMVLWQERPIEYDMRASATYICPNHFAHLLLIVMCFSAALVANPAAGIPLRFVAGYALLVMTPALFLTFSRSALIGVVVGVSSIILLIALRASKMRFFWTLVGLPVVLLVGFFTLWKLSPDFQARMQSAAIGDIRPQIWADTITMIKSSPLLGYGPGSYESVIGEFREHYNQTDKYLRYAHNEFLHVLAEYGVVGFLLFLGILGYLIIRMHIWVMRCQSRRDAYLVAGCIGAILGSLVHALFDLNFHIFANVHLLVFLVGLTVAVLDNAGAIARVETPSNMYRWLSLPVALLCLVGAGLAAQWTAVSWLDRKINHLVFQSVDMESYTATLRKLCGRSIKLDPGYTPPYRFLADDFRGLSYWNIQSEAQKKQQLEKAIALYEKALAGNKRDGDAQYGLIKCREQQQDDAVAEAGYLELIRQNPMRMHYRVHYGLFLRKRDRDEEALAVFQAALERDKLNPALNVNIRQLNRKLLDKQSK